MNRRAFLFATMLRAVPLLGARALAEGGDPARLRVALLPDENASTII